MPHTLLLTPTDTLYFKDGRPMDGSLAGHTAAWPAPHLINTALHAALHRAFAHDENSHEKLHAHRAARSGKILSEDRERDGRFFGALKTAGPFPISPKTASGTDGTWYFPTPFDLVKITGQDGQEVFVMGVAPASIASGASSLPVPLTHALAATQPPSKDNKPAAWLRADAWQNYLSQETAGPAIIPPAAFAANTDIADIETRIGIGIDAATGTQDGERFYSAETLRLREGWRLGVLAEADDKGAGDLIGKLFPQNAAGKTHIVIGGQQRLCSVELKVDATDELKLPQGISAGFQRAHIDGKEQWLVKWVLLAPAIFPKITAEQKGTPHPGGWLPTWVNEKTGAVLLKDGDTARGGREPREAWRERVRKLPAIAARLVAALVGKPQVVTGWALGQTPLETEGDTGSAGAKPAQLAVPAGSLYYFACESEGAAKALAAALNWHGASTAHRATGGTPPVNLTATLINRRSTLLGEKGYGLGVCGTWQPLHPSSSS